MIVDGRTGVRAHCDTMPIWGDRFLESDNSFDAAMAVFSLHHWTDKARGCAEMRRVSNGRNVLLTFEPEHRDAWLLDYFPEFC